MSAGLESASRFGVAQGPAPGGRIVSNKRLRRPAKLVASARCPAAAWTRPVAELIAVGTIVSGISAAGATLSTGPSERPPVRGFMT